MEYPPSARVENCSIRRANQDLLMYLRYTDPARTLNIIHKERPTFTFRKRSRAMICGRGSSVRLAFVCDSFFFSGIVH